MADDSPMSDRLPIGVLAADPKNPRKMSDRARDGLSVSLETFGPLDIVFNELGLWTLDE